MELDTFVNVTMSSEKRHTEDDREIRDTLDELNFINFCEAILKETETQEMIFQTDFEESQLYKLWQATGETSNEQVKLEH
jgi:hypothetical protein